MNKPDYTMHEHYDGFTLINMNGRLYAPVIGRMLQPDIVIQDQYNAQAYNSYSYCLNNPLRYTDPSGYVVTPYESFFSFNHTYLLDLNSTTPKNNTYSTDLSQGNKFFLKSIYTVDEEGYVRLAEKNDDNYDVLYTQDDWNSGEMKNGMIIYDQSILSNLVSDRVDFNGNYAISFNKKEMFKVFNYMINNTAVEWGIDGYRTSLQNDYVLRTSHKTNKCNSFIAHYSKFDKIFSMHSHPDIDGTMGASGYTNYTYFGDMANITELYNEYLGSGMRNIHTWFSYNGKETIFPLHLS